MTSTRFTIEGYQVVHSLGIVRGITVRSRSIVGRAVSCGGHITNLPSGRKPPSVAIRYRCGGQ